MNVLPSLASGMIHISRNRPDDPIEFLFTHLFSEAERKEKESEKDAYERYNDLLIKAETQ